MGTYRGYKQRLLACGTTQVRPRFYEPRSIYNPHKKIAAAHPITYRPSIPGLEAALYAKGCAEFAEKVSDPALLQVETYLAHENG